MSGRDPPCATTTRAAPGLLTPSLCGGVGGDFLFLRAVGLAGRERRQLSTDIPTTRVSISQQTTTACCERYPTSLPLYVVPLPLRFREVHVCVGTALGTAGRADH